MLVFLLCISSLAAARLRRRGQHPAVEPLRELYGEKNAHKLLLRGAVSPPDDSIKLAVVQAIFGGYDSGPSKVHPNLLHDPRVQFFFFSDDEEYRVPKPWQHVRLPYHLWDTALDVGCKHSFSNPEITRNNRMNMCAKYYNHVGWRTPEVASCRYVLYVGGGFDLRQASDLYNVSVSKLAHHDMYFQSHPKRPNGVWTILEEAKYASGQQRYRVDDVIGIAKEYELEGFPMATQRVIRNSMILYDSHSAAVRRWLLAVYRETQCRTLEDQVTMPYYMWKLNVTHRALIENHPAMCVEFLHRQAKGCRGRHITKHYGRA